MEKIRVIDDNYIYYEGRQFVSLQRFYELKNSELQEMKLLSERIEELTEENKSFETLLKTRLLKQEGREKNK